MSKSSCPNASSASNLLLKEGGGNLNAKDYHGCTPLHVLGRHVSTSCSPTTTRRFDLLIALGADIVARGKSGQTPIFEYARFSSLASLRRMIGHGASADVLDANGRTPLAFACFCQRHCDRKGAILELLRRSPRETRRAVGNFGLSAIDDLVHSIGSGPFTPWQNHVIEELLRAGAFCRHIAPP
jgi:hypothetical protein